MDPTSKQHAIASMISALGNVPCLLLQLSRPIAHDSAPTLLQHVPCHPITSHQQLHWLSRCTLPSFPGAVPSTSCNAAPCAVPPGRVIAHLCRLSFVHLSLPPCHCSFVRPTPHIVCHFFLARPFLPPRRPSKRTEPPLRCCATRPCLWRS